jgi:hypothetical protein
MCWSKQPPILLHVPYNTFDRVYILLRNRIFLMLHGGQEHNVKVDRHTLQLLNSFDSRHGGHCIGFMEFLSDWHWKDSD